jgi:hypothetical protein
MWGMVESWLFEILSRFLDQKNNSIALIKKAREVAEDPKIMGSPFQTRASQQGFYYQGGKMDDITILTGIVRYSEYYD